MAGSLRRPRLSSPPPRPHYPAITWHHLLLPSPARFWALHSPLLGKLLPLLPSLVLLSSLRLPPEVSGLSVHTLPAQLPHRVVIIHGHICLFLVYFESTALVLILLSPASLALGITVDE